MDSPGISDLAFKRRRQRNLLFEEWLGSTSSWRPLSPRRRVEARYVLDVFSGSADNHERDARFSITVVALLFSLAAFTVAVLTYFVALAPPSQVALDAAAGVMVTSSTDTSGLFDMALLISSVTTAFSLATLALGAILGGLAAADRKRARTVRRLLFLDERFHAHLESEEKPLRNPVSASM
ncbi:hypothetical protein [Microbacterium sp. KNMS]